MAFVSSSNNNTSSTNEAVNTAHGVSTASTQVNAANSTNIDNLSDAVICRILSDDRYAIFIRILLALLPTRPPVPPPHGAAVDRPALRVIILGGIIYTRENMGNIRSEDGIDMAYPNVLDTSIGGFLEHRYTVSSLMDTTYWISEHWDQLEYLRIREDRPVIRFIKLSMFSLSERLKADNTIRVNQ
ncbi:hypothetical protein Tco_0457798 [Tanacetum coccineum]